MSLCPEFDERNAMTDSEFWSHVFQEEGMPEWDDDEPETESEFSVLQPCIECGATEACGYDQEGRPMIHTGNKIEQ